jgi:hypothetical protein
MLTYYFLLKAAARCNSLEYKNKVVRNINAKLRPKRNLPFVVYMSEDSSPDKLVFRVEHRKAHTSNKVYVTIKENPSRRYRSFTLNIDASDGSNWHHLKFEFVTWFRNTLNEGVSEFLMESLS